MHDIKAIRDNPDLYEQAWSAKGRSGVVAEALSLDATLRAAQTALQEAQSRRNDLSKQIGQAKGRKDEAEASRLMAEVETLKGDLETQAQVERETGEALRDLLAGLPNLPAPDVPPGADEDDNQEVRRWGEPFAIASPKDHVDLGETLPRDPATSDAFQESVDLCPGTDDSHVSGIRAQGGFQAGFVLGVPPGHHHAEG